MSGRPLILYGNGAIARMVYSFVRRVADVRGFAVDGSCIEAGRLQFCGLPLVPFEVVERSFDPVAHDFLIAMGFLEMNRLRQRKYAEAKLKGYRFAKYIHPSVTLHDEVSIAENCIVLDHASIHAGCTLHEGVIVSSNVNIGHDCEIGPATWINSGVSIAGGCRIGEGSFLGINASVGHGVQLGARNFIGGSTLIARDTADDQAYATAPGDPLRLNSTDFLRFSAAMKSR